MNPPAATTARPTASQLMHAGPDRPLPGQAPACSSTAHRPVLELFAWCRSPSCRRPCRRALGGRARAGRAQLGDPARPPAQVQRTPRRQRDRTLVPAFDAAGRKLLGTAIERSLRLSARGYHRILKVARTIADMNEAGSIGATHVAEAIQSRRGLGEFVPNRAELHRHPFSPPAPPRQELAGLVVGFIVVIAALAAGYTWLVLNWSYSAGERAGLRAEVLPRRAGCARPGKASWRSSRSPAARRKSSNSRCATTKSPPTSTP